MHTETVMRIRGSADAVFHYAARVECWPKWLPHYRSVRELGALGLTRTVEMKARRGPLPVWWWARQVRLPEERRIRYTHVRGVTRGMEVEWRLEPAPAGDVVVVTVVHDLDLRWPLVGGAVARWILGPLFVEPIAKRTLARIKELVEGSRPERPEKPVRT
ncbi:MAG TPA: SRPBCC family protein [bacterium]|nr:SRPBCC family protein [bacterium]